jgi:mannose-6-phosphate isomerase-like protein (cupin superfamily)
MTYAGDGERTGVLIPRVAQQDLEVGSMTATVVASMRQTGGRYSLYRLDLAPNGGGARPHFHRGFAESFQVLAGIVQLYDGTDWVNAGDGDHLTYPRAGSTGSATRGPSRCRC